MFPKLPGQTNFNTYYLVKSI